MSLTNPDENGVAESMILAIKDANINPDQVDYINTHGTGTKINDPIECKAIRKVFGNRASILPASSTKSSLGHAMGASSALEALATLLAVQNNCAPPTLNYEIPDEECIIDSVANSSRNIKIDVAISNSFAFGGSNGVIVFKKWKE